MKQGNKDSTRVDGECCKRGTGSTASDFSLTPAEERDVLQFDPWGERDATYKVLRSGFGAVRKSHQCVICFGPIDAGDRVWARAEVDDGKIATFHFCTECCWCIARRYDEDEDDPHSGFDRMYARWDIGRQRAEQVRATASTELR
jgi:hypothetical protein